MSIKAKCGCGQAFAAKDELAGKTVRCPKCKDPIRIPKASPSEATSVAQLLEEAGLSTVASTGRKCPECESSFPEDAIICVNCGYNERLGQKMRTRVIVGDLDSFEERESFGHERLDQAAMEMEEAEVQQERLEAGMPWWGYLIILIAIIVGAALMGSVPEEHKTRMLISILIVLPVGLGLFFAFLRLNLIAKIFRG